mgnify:CR=1 FL=1
MKYLLKPLALLIYFLIPQTTSAETVVLRSGDHPSFSRLVLQFERDIPDWTIGRTDRGYNLRIIQDGFLADTSEIYRKITRNRLAGIEFDTVNTTLSLNVSCDCHLDAFNFRDGKLVVDIKDGPAPEGSPFENTFIQEQPQTETSTSTPMLSSPSTTDRINTTLRSRPSPPAAILHLPLTTNRTVKTYETPPIELFAAQQIQQATTQNTPPTSDISIDTTTGAMHSERRSETEAVLLRELERAASQGLLDAHLPNIPQEVTPTDVAISTLPELNAEIPADDTLPGHFNITADTSIDQSLIHAIQGVNVIDEHLSCELGEKLDIRTWGDPDNIPKTLTDARMALLDGRDQLDETAAIKLVQSYLYASFGAEAVQVLNLLPDQTYETRALAQIASLSDAYDTVSSGPLASLRNCPNAGAFWAILAIGSIPAQGVDHNAVLEVATSLPPHLRSYFGARLMRSYTRANDLSRVQLLQTAIGRGHEDVSSEVKLAGAMVDLVEGQQNVADETLLDIVHDNTALSLDALQVFLQSALERHTDIAPEIVGNAEALAFEYDGTEEGVKIQFLLARIYSQKHQYARASNALEQLDGQIRPFDMRFAWEEFTEGILTEADDTDFLTLFYRYRESLRAPRISIETRRDLATRLIDLGMETAGRKVLNVDDDFTADDKLLLARAAFLRGNLDEALRLSEGLASPTAAALRHQIYLSMDDLNSAITTARENNLTETIPDLLWRQGQWQDIMEIETLPLHSTAAQIMLDHQEEPLIIAEPVDDLATGQAQLSQSKKEREALDALLMSLSPPEDAITSERSNDL